MQHTCPLCGNKTEIKYRTLSQNSALHLWFTLLSDALNDGGLTVQTVLEKKMDVEWDASKVKELLWRPAQKVILKKKSTKELKKQEDINKVFDHLNIHLSEKFGLEVPQFPSFENMDQSNG